jgi:hypothetical protein
MYNARLLHMSERQRLPKLTENKLKYPKKEINGITEELMTKTKFT